MTLLQQHVTMTCPVAPGDLVAFDIGDGRLRVSVADALNWGSGTGPDGEGRIEQFAVLRAPAGMVWAPE